MKSGKTITPSFSEYSAPFFRWELCPHVRRLRDEGKEITRRWCEQQRGWLENYVIGDSENGIKPDAIAAKPIGDITRADLVELPFPSPRQARGEAEHGEQGHGDGEGQQSATKNIC